MNKNQKLLLNDYLQDNSDKRLALFISMLNTEFKLDKKNKEQVMQLISDYKLSPNNQRLNILEKFIMGSKKPDGLFRPKKAKDIAAGISKLEPEEIKLSEDQILAESIRKQLMPLFQSRGSGIMSAKTEEKIKELQDELKVIEARLGMYDVVPPEKSKLDIIFGLFGHWNDPESIAYELRCGNQPQVQVKSNQDVRGAFIDMQALSGETFRQFHLTSNELQGGTKGVKHVAVWTFVDVRSGLGPRDSNFIETNLDTGETKNAAGNSGNFAGVGRPNLNSARFGAK